jgi:hypothetical protein
MDKKLELLLKFLGKLNINRATLDVDVYEGEIENVDGGMTTDTGSYFNLPQPLNSYVDNIVDPYLEEYFKTYKPMKGVDYDDFTGQEIITFHFYPKERKIKITSEEKWSDVEGSESQINLNEYPDFKKVVDQVFENFDYEGEIEVTYEGSGDDGYINETMELDGNEEDLDNDLEEIIHELLRTFYGAWGNDEGSSGIVRITEDMITIEHNWYTSEFRESHHKLEIQL